jgi:hypothetical protein
MSRPRGEGHVQESTVRTSKTLTLAMKFAAALVFAQGSGF